MGTVTQSAKSFQRHKLTTPIKPGFRGRVEGYRAVKLSLLKIDVLAHYQEISCRCFGMGPERRLFANIQDFHPVLLGQVKLNTLTEVRSRVGAQYLVPYD
jgi:hypothetical protein